MKYSRKSYGVLPKIIHSPASYCVSGSPAAVSAAVREENGRVPDSLTLLVRAGGRYVMDPADCIETDAGCYEIYTAEVPSSEICGSFFSYAIAEEGLFSDVTDFYTVPVIAAERRHRPEYEIHSAPWTKHSSSSSGRFSCKTAISSSGISRASTIRDTPKSA